MSSDNRMQDCRKKLFVEGVDDQQVIYHLENHYRLRDICEVVNSGSVDDAKSGFELYLNENASKVDVLGIVLDADTDVEARWRSISNIISLTQNYDVPKELPSVGLILTPNKPRKPKIGVWVMPDNKLPGMLEDFLAKLATENDELLKYVDSVLKDLEGKKLNRYKPIHKAKARIHTFLAWQEESGLSLGTAITKQYLNPEAETSKVFVNWFENLFS